MKTLVNDLPNVLLLLSKGTRAPRNVANGHDPGHESRPPGQQARPDAPNEAKLAGTLHKHIAKPAYGQEGEDGEQ
jgi:hypothetical protein